MPIYEYRCPNGHEFEVFQSMSEDPISRCQECGAPVERVFHPVAVHFKGSGFYTTDYGGKDGKGSKAEAKKGTEKADKASSAEGTSGGSDGRGSGGDKAKAGSGDD